MPVNHAAEPMTLDLQGQRCPGLVTAVGAQSRRDHLSLRFSKRRDRLGDGGNGFSRPGRHLRRQVSTVRIAFGVRAQARSKTFRSSRTLPGQSYSANRFSAAVEIL